MTLCDTEEKNVYFKTSRQMKACFLHVVYGFTEQRELGLGGGGENGKCDAFNHYGRAEI